MESQRGANGHARELVVDVVAETGRVDDGQRDADAVLFELCEGVPSALVLDSTY